MQSDAWKALSCHQQALNNLKISDLFIEDSNRFKNFSLSIDHLLFDYSKQRVTYETLQKLIALAESKDLAKKINALFSGERINRSENRSVLHTALRDFSHTLLKIDNENIKPKIQAVLQKMAQFKTQLDKGEIKGCTNKCITDVLCLGIGGSELGPLLVSEALHDYQTETINLHYVSNVFGGTLKKTLKHLNPETTLCIISSKSFTTPETLYNAEAVKKWFKTELNLDNQQAQQLNKHFIAVTAAVEKAHAFGILEDHIFEFWDWIGGRYSIWSAVGLPIVLKIGMDHFIDFLHGAEMMDRHFAKAPFAANMPVLMALLGVWNTNFWGANTFAILPYDDRLQLLPAYLQQLEMESNGKRVSEQGEELPYTTAPIVWGGVGCNGQHAFMQLLHQGTQTVPVDFLIAAKGEKEFFEQHKLLFASCLSQSKALMEGQPASSFDNKDWLKHAKSTPGNCPSNTIVYSELNPYTLGSLIALYEHKVFVQGVLWGINSFDQWGVELGKTLAKKILPLLTTSSSQNVEDSSTQGLITYFQQHNRA